MIAIELVVAGLLLGSISVNILALGAFWVTPSLRTTANRFVINLLVANLVCCIVLGPSLLVNSVITKTATNQYNESLANANDDNHYLPVLGEKFTLTEIRCWGLDFAAALGALSVLLVVGDTWCAITDPLRYHTRISEVKAWSYIATIWLLGIIFGIASALRGDQQSSQLPDQFLEDDVYNTIFSYTYFFIAIFLPFIIICSMYRRIFSEARNNGQRMRQNGSSPLLQSAINLSTLSATQQHQKLQEAQKEQTLTASLVDNNNSEGLIMRIDKQNQYSINITNFNSNLKTKESCLKPLLLQTPTHKVVDEKIVQNKATLVQKLDKNHNNILLSLSHAKCNLHAEKLNTFPLSGKLRRNSSARNLLSAEDHQFLQATVNGLRHVQSTPNFQKLVALENTNGQNNKYHQVISQMPTVQVPTKALSYMTSIRHRLSNASSLFKYREESRAARISILVIIMFFVSYLPYGILVLMQGHTDFIEASNQALLAIFTVVVANLASPFIFAYRNQRVRRGVRRLLRIDKKTNARLQKLTNTNTNYNNNTSFTSNNFNNNNNNNNSNASNNLNNSNTSPTKPYQLPHRTKVRIANIHRSTNQCKFLTPNSAVALNGYIIEMEQCPSNDINSLCIQKKSILTRVCDSSRKWGCNFTTNSCTSNDDHVEV